MTDKLIGVQLDPQSVYDEGPDRVLDILQETAGVNALLVYSHSYYCAKNRPAELLAQDHGVPKIDETKRNLTNVWVKQHEKYFGGTFLRHEDTPPDREYAGKEVFNDLIEPCRKRGMKLFARILEPGANAMIQVAPNWSKAATVDLFGRVGSRLCWNNTHYRNFVLGTVEDLFKTYPFLEGLQFGSENVGPLSRLLYSGETPFCFCDFCRAKAVERGIDIERAREGFRRLHEFSRLIASERPAGGVVAGLLGLLIRFPEILAWENLFVSGYKELLALMRGAIKAIKPGYKFGVHVDHQQSTWDIVFRSQMDIAEMAQYADFIKFIAYHDVAGPRLRDWVVAPLCRGGFLQELSTGAAMDLLYDLMGYDKAVEPNWEEAANEGLSPDYVYRLTKFFTDQAKGATAIYPGIALDVPFGNRRLPCDPDKLQAAVVRSFEAGAEGVVISREYNEMRLDSLRAVGRALKQVG
jgi:hypothetical protein